MKKNRFAVIVDDSTREQQNIITEFLRGQECSFWHYLSDVWLVYEIGKDWSAVILRDKLHEIMPTKTALVLKVPSGSGWAGFGPANVFKWVRESWSKE